MELWPFKLLNSCNNFKMKVNQNYGHSTDFSLYFPAWHVHDTKHTSGYKFRTVLTQIQIRFQIPKK